MTGNRRCCPRISASPFSPPPRWPPLWPRGDSQEPGVPADMARALSNGDKTTWTVVVKWIWYLNQQKSICDCSGEIHPGPGDDVEVQEVQRHLPGYFSPLPPATQDQLQAAVDPGEQATALPPQDGQGKETAQNLIGFERRDGEAIKQTGRPQRVKRPINNFV